MAIEDMGVRLVVDNLGGFTSGMDTVNQKVAQGNEALGGLAKTTKSADQATRQYGTGMTTNMRPALSAVNSLFHASTSALLLFMSTQKNMSDETRNLTVALTALSVAMSGVIALYRIYQAQAAIAAAGQAVFNTAVGAGTGIAAAFGITCAGVFWPLTILAAVLAAVAGAVYLLWRYWDDLLDLFNMTPPELKKMMGAITDYENESSNLSLTLDTLNAQHKKLQDELQQAQAEYNHAKDTALGYKSVISLLEADLARTKSTMEALKGSISDARNEMQQLAQAQLLGEQAASDEEFALQMALKRARLEQLQGADNQDVIDQMQNQLEIMQLQADLDFEPQHRDIQEMYETLTGANDEMAPEDVLIRLRDQHQILQDDMDLLSAYESQAGTVAGSLNTINSEVDATLSVMSDNIDAITEQMYQLEVQIWATKAAADAANAALAQAKLEYEQANAETPSFWDAVKAGLGGTIPLYGAYQGIGQLETLWNKIFGRQFGGTVTPASVPVRVGERGPEVVMLPAGAGVLPNTYNTSYNITAHYSNPQQPQSIALDLEYIRMRSRA